MKFGDTMKLFTSFCIATTFTTFAATTDAAPRKVIGENFTATWCGYCPDVANGLILLQNEFPDTFFSLQIHGGDEYATTWGNARNNFYGVPGYPTVWVDGLLSQVGSYGSPNGNYSQLRALFMQRQAMPTDVTLAMCGSSIDSDTYSVSVTVAIEGGGEAKNMRIHCAQLIYDYPSNPNYNYACFMQAINEDRSVTAGSSATVDFEFNLDSASMANLEDVHFIAWAQSTNTSGPSEVYQAEKHDYQGGDCQIDHYVVGQKGDFGTIGDAVNASGTGDSISVMPGTYYENIDFGGRGISLTSTGGADVTIIDGGDTACVVRLLGNPTETTIIDGFTLQNGNSPIGGGILTDGSPILLNCVVRDNIAQYGGGLYALNSNSGLPSLSNMRFCNNSPDDIFGKWEDAGDNIFEDDCGDTLPCPADVSGDSVVNVADLLAIIDAWGGSSPDADVNDDGIVDVIDLLEVVGNWGPC